MDEKDVVVNEEKTESAVQQEISAEGNAEEKTVETEEVQQSEDDVESAQPEENAEQEPAKEQEPYSDEDTLSEDEDDIMFSDETENLLEAYDETLRILRKVRL